MTTSERRPHYHYQDAELRAQFVQRFECLDSQLGKGIGEGWQPLVGEAALALDVVAPGWVAAQIKEKFGTLRFYYDLPEGIDRDHRLAARAIAHWAETRSAHICEWCGDNGELRRDDYWLLTLCDHCQGRRGQGHRPWAEG